MPHSPLILFWIKGLLLSRHTPQIRASDGFLICVRESAPPSHSKRIQAISAGVRGGCGTKYDFRALHLRIEAIIGSYTMDFTSIFEGRKSSGRKAVRQTPCRIHSGRQSRPHFLAFWPHLLVFLRISVRRRQCVKHAYNRGIGVSTIRKIPQNRRIFRLVAGVSRVSGVHTEKNQHLCNQGGSVCIRWTMGGFTMNPQCELYKRKNI